MRTGPATRSDMVLDSRTWSNRVIGKISPWINLDSHSPRVRLASEKAFLEEIAWANHLSISAVLLNAPTFDCVHYGQVLASLVCTKPESSLQFWVRIPLYYPSVSLQSTNEDDDIVSERSSTDRGHAALASRAHQARIQDTWEGWNLLRSMCESHENIGVALELTADLPSIEVLKRWLGEPIKAVIIPVKIFLTNRKGYPALSQRHQQFFKLLFKVGVHSTRKKETTQD